MPEQHFIYAFILTFLAGFSTIIGGVLAIILKNKFQKILSVGLGFSAGIMVYLSFFELLKEATVIFEKNGTSENIFSVPFYFICGLVIAGIIDFFTHKKVEVLPDGCNYSCDCQIKDFKKDFYKTGIFTSLAIAIHNFPEGILTFTASSVNLTLGLSVAFAVAIHNIPEGFCVALPLYFATGSKKKSLFYTAISGMAEPLGAILAFLFIYPFLTDGLIGGMLAVVAGIMIYVAFDELLPMAGKNGQWHRALAGMVFGMLTMYFVLNFLI